MVAYSLHNPTSRDKIIVPSVYIPPTTSKYAPTSYRDIIYSMYEDALAICLKANIQQPNVVLVGYFNAYITNLT